VTLSTGGCGILVIINGPVRAMQEKLVLDPQRHLSVAGLRLRIF